MENRLLKQYFDRKCIIVIVSIKKRERQEGKTQKLPLDL